MKVLNLYAGLGGNRAEWGDEHEVVAVEKDAALAKLYQERFPHDLVVVGDAHKYLIDHFREFDFVWSSRPCVTHSRVAAAFNAHGKGMYVYPDMGLYEEIIFLRHFFKGRWVVENVIPYYKPLIEPTAVRDRHFFWANFAIPSKGRVATCDEPIEHVKVSTGRYGFDVSDYKGKQRKTQLLRNLINPKLGRFVMDCAFKQRQEVLV